MKFSEWYLANDDTLQEIGLSRMSQGRIIWYAAKADAEEEIAAKVKQLAVMLHGPAPATEHATLDTVLADFAALLALLDAGNKATRASMETLQQTLQEISAKVGVK